MIATPDTILDRWYWHGSDRETDVIVVPDGCRDLIYTSEPGRAPGWHVSPLFDTTWCVVASESAESWGWRLRPGLRIDEQDLLAALGNCSPDDGDIGSIIEDYTHASNVSGDVLRALADHTRSIAAIARDLGVTPRTLQRQVHHCTGRTPVYWRRLVRARACARDVAAGTPLVDAAWQAGYADQAHMTRECRHWFGVTPTALRQHPDMQASLAARGYGDG